MRHIRLIHVTLIIKFLLVITICYPDDSVVNAEMISKLINISGIETIIVDL